MPVHSRFKTRYSSRLILILFRNCPDACFLIISNPVNSTVPIFAESLKKQGVYNKNKLFGVTTLDVTRARTFISQLKGCDVNDLDVPVVGGHAGTTIVPILSRVFLIAFCNTVSLTVSFRTLPV